MERAACSHYLPICSPSSRRARQRRTVLTIRANGNRRRKRRLSAVRSPITRTVQRLQSSWACAFSTRRNARAGASLLRLFPRPGRRDRRSSAPHRFLGARQNQKGNRAFIVAQFGCLTRLNGNRYMHLRADSGGIAAIRQFSGLPHRGERIQDRNNGGAALALKSVSDIRRQER